MVCGVVGCVSMCELLGVVDCCRVVEYAVGDIFGGKIRGCVGGRKSKESCGLSPRERMRRDEACLHSISKGDISVVIQ